MQPTQPITPVKGPILNPSIVNPGNNGFDMVYPNHTPEKGEAFNDLIHIPDEDYLQTEGTLNQVNLPVLHAGDDKADPHIDQTISGRDEDAPQDDGDFKHPQQEDHLADDAEDKPQHEVVTSIGVTSAC